MKALKLTAEFESSAIHAIDYSLKEQILSIQFTSGGTYDYPNVPFEVVKDMLTADSVGKFFHQVIKPYGIKEFRK